MRGLLKRRVGDPPGCRSFRLWRIFEVWTRAEDDYNRSSFRVSILNVTVWDAMTPGIGIDVQFDVDGSFVQIKLPYLHVRLTLLPCLDPDHRTWRTKDWPEREREGAP